MGREGVGESEIYWSGFYCVSFQRGPHLEIRLNLIKTVRLGLGC